MLNWNGLAMTQKCLGSLRRQTYKNFRVIIVDNGSTDGSISWLEQQNDVVLIKNKRNLGFARAFNQGILRALSLGTHYVAAVNNDTVLDKQWLQHLVAFMESHQQVGFAQGATLQDGQKHLYDSSGIYLEKGFIPNQRALGQDNPRLDLPAIGPNAAGAIYRSTMLQHVSTRGGDFFDRRFFAYVEDVDFNLRCTARGFAFAFVPEARIYHEGSATGNRIAKRKMFWGARNLVWLVYKNAPLGVLRQTWRLIIRSHLANLQFLWREQRPHFLPYLSGLIVGVLCIPRFYRDRCENLRKQRISDADLLALLVPSNPPLHNPLRRLRNLVK